MDLKHVPQHQANTNQSINVRYITVYLQFIVLFFFSGGGDDILYNVHLRERYEI